MRPPCPCASAARASGALRARARCTLPISIVIAGLLWVGATGDAVPRVHGQELRVEPSIASDLALWPHTGLEPWSQVGGMIHSPAYEPHRPLVWIASGPRVEALAVEGERVRRLGRTLALPELVDQIAVGDGVVLATDRSSRPGLWLIDGRDPTWPRFMSPLRLGAPVAAMAIEGRTAVVAAGSDLVELDLSDPTSPREVAREHVPEVLERNVVRAVARSGGRSIALLADGTLLVGPIRAGERMARKAHRPIDAQLPLLWFDGERIVQADQLANVSGSDLLTGGGSWSVPDFERRRLLRFGVDGDRVTVLWVSRDETELSLQEYQLPDPEDPDAHRAEPVAPAIRLATRARERPFYVSGAWATRPGQPHLLVHEGRIRVVPPEVLRGRRPLDTPVLESRTGTVLALAGRSGFLAVAGRQGRVDLLDVRHPDAPRLVGRWRAVVDPPRTDTVEQLLWHGDRLWVLLWNDLIVLDVSDPRFPREERRLPLQGSSRMGMLGGRLWVPELWGLNELDVLSLDRVYHSMPWETGIEGLALTGDQLWIATLGRQRGGRLWPVSVAADGPPVTGSAIDLRQRISAITGLEGQLVVLLEDREAGDVLKVFDVRDPRDVQERGRLGFSSSSDSRNRAHLRRWGEGVLLAHPDDGLVWIDLSVPELPDEIGRLSMPRAPAGQRSARVLHTEGHFAWAGGWWGGLVAVRDGPIALDKDHRLWLPALGDR